MRQTGLCLFGFHVNGTEEPDVGNLHVRVCGGVRLVTGASTRKRTETYDGLMFRE